MAIQEVNDLITVRVPTTEKGYEDKGSGRQWTKSSDWFPRWKLGVQYCADRDAKLLTLDDAVEFRHDMKGDDHSYERQLTGTLIGFVSDGRAGLRAYVYDPSAEELLDIANRLGGGEWYVDVAKRSALERKFVNSDRTFLVPAQNLVLPVEANANGDSQYRKNDDVRCLMPNNAAKNAAIIKGRGFGNGLVLFYRPQLSANTMRILPVGLVGIGDVCSNDGFGYGGRARGLVHVAQKSSSGNKGRQRVRSR
ncbi:hypothetical protein HY490_01025 [Candidatus Woesearchaeota archaeon]|nr:hypothetical protein [Candidatus Woesearchaeota archaeon]